MFTITEVTKDSRELQQLIAELDAFLSALYPAESNHCIEISAQQDGSIRCLLVYDATGQAVGCGAVMLQDNHAGEIKRVFIKPSCRGKLLGNQIVAHLETLAADSGCHVLRLETGIHQQPAIKLYQNCGYEFCDPFPPYSHDPLSVFMQRQLTD